MPNRDQAITASGLNIIAAIWLVLSPFILGFGGTALATNAIVVGIVVGVLALIRVFSPLSTGWLSWINAIAGLWLIIAPFSIGYLGLAALWNSLILGLIVLVLSLWSSAATAQPSTR